MGEIIGKTEIIDCFYSDCGVLLLIYIYEREIFRIGQLMNGEDKINRC